MFLSTTTTVAASFVLINSQVRICDLSEERTARDRSAAFPVRSKMKSTENSEIRRSEERSRVAADSKVRAPEKSQMRTTRNLPLTSPCLAFERCLCFAASIMRHTISILVENKFGVLTRVAGLFSGRGYNIDTLNVGPTHDPNTSRMTIVTRGDDATLEQIVKQLNKLVDVLQVLDFRDGEYVDRELILAKVGVDSKTRAEVMQITDIFRAKIVDVQPKSLTIEITGNESKVEKFIDLMKTFGVLELTRTGKVALPRK